MFLIIAISHEIFAIDTWRAVICSLGHGRKHMLTILPTIYSCKDRRTCLRRCFKEDFKAVRILIEKVSCEIAKLAIIPAIGRGSRIHTS